MDLYQKVLTYVATVPTVNQWPELATLIARAAEARPRHWRLPALACEAVGGTVAQAIPAVAAMACLHLAIKAVDDMLDADPQGPHHELGYPMTANVAGALQAAGLAAITQSEAPAASQALVLHRLHAMLLTTALGQYWDVQNPNTEEAYWRVARTKSAPFFGATLFVGAALGGADVATATQLGQLGELYGEMIQIHDDLNDVMAVPASVDWLQARHPLPILFAELVPHPDQARFRVLRRQVEEPNALAEAQEIVLRCGAVSYALDQLWQRHQQAIVWQHQMQLAQPEVIGQLLAEVIEPVEQLLHQVREQHPVVVAG
jgi:geranylgeranyl diphosphate synthase, type I